jgi:glycosyltransferase involved in cell wall biosynthesis
MSSQPFPPEKPLPLVTVITPSYNQAQYLEETICSVLSQDYPHLEYIIVDGGSTDGSQEIIRKYADRLAWWVSEKDSGQADAINKGFARATGEIVAWLNSDDLYRPGAIAAAVAELVRHPECGMVFGDVVSIDAGGQPFNIMTFGDWGLEDLLQFRIIGQPAVFLRRAVLERAGYLDLSYNLVLDIELWMRVAQQAPIQHVPKRWAAARFHATAKNVSQAPHYSAEAERLLAWIAAHPGLRETYRRLERPIRAGMHCYSARYLLDGGLPGPALRAYLRCFWASPRAALPDRNRILYAAATLVLPRLPFTRGLLRWIEGRRIRYLERRKQQVQALLAGEQGRAQA